MDVSNDEAIGNAEDAGFHDGAKTWSTYSLSTSTWIPGQLKACSYESEQSSNFTNPAARFVDTTWDLPATGGLETERGHMRVDAKKEFATFAAKHYGSAAKLLQTVCIFLYLLDSSSRNT